MQLESTFNVYTIEDIIEIIVITKQKYYKNNFRHFYSNIKTEIENIDIEAQRRKNSVQKKVMNKLILDNRTINDVN